MIVRIGFALLLIIAAPCLFGCQTTPQAQLVTPTPTPQVSAVTATPTPEPASFGDIKPGTPFARTKKQSIVWPTRPPKLEIKTAVEAGVLTRPNLPAGEQAGKVGPGLVVYFPQVAGDAPAAQRGFSAACGLYLMLNVAGRPECSRSPGLDSVWRHGEQMHGRAFPFNQVRPTLAEGRQIATRLGATHVAMGEFREANSQVTLTYRVHKIDGAPIGQPVTVNGTYEQVIARLPDAANRLGVTLGLPAKSASPVRATVTEMSRLGALTANGNHGDDGHRFLRSLMPRVPLADFIYLSATQEDSEPVTTRKAIARLLRNFPHNGLTVHKVSGANRSALVEFLPSLEGSARLYPRNFALAHAQTRCYREKHDFPREYQSARRVILNSPKNPDSYLALAFALNQATDRMRQGRSVDQLSEGELRFLQDVYSRGYEAASRAAELDPAYALAWLRTSRAATFAGFRPQAEYAWEQAKKAGLPAYDLYSWAFELFHPKWGGSQEQAWQVYREAADTNYDNVANALNIAVQIRDCGIPGVESLSSEVISKYQTMWERVAQQNPKDVNARYSLAQIYGQAGDMAASIREYQAVVDLRPTDAEAYFDLGLALAHEGRYREALAAIQKCVALNPEHPRGLNRLRLLRDTVATSGDRPQNP